MSSQKSRSRNTKYFNEVAFKNTLHNKSKEIKALNSLTFEDLCVRCHQILKWKVKYNKYKKITKPKRCIRCSKPNVTKSYYTICDVCSAKENICPKCGCNDRQPREDVTLNEAYLSDDNNSSSSGEST
ncbi:hypothetical protein GJ496_004003 [Pomphorhynchus laevis]|nr:hypothetical protein GJ496_004003 [Pomphorhynchus laevis]